MFDDCNVCPRFGGRLKEMSHSHLFLLQYVSVFGGFRE